VDGLYGFQTLIPDGVLSISVIGNGGTLNLEPVNVNTVSGQLMNLQQGVLLTCRSPTRKGAGRADLLALLEVDPRASDLRQRRRPGPRAQPGILDPIVLDPVSGR